jgi:hypothetical protein
MLHVSTNLYGSELGVGFQNSATVPDLGFYAARSYSLLRPPRTGRRLICFWGRSATGWSGRGGRVEMPAAVGAASVVYCADLPGSLQLSFDS